MNLQEGATPLEILQLIRLLQTGEKTNIELALQLAEGLGHPLAFNQYLQDLLPLYQLAFKSTKKRPLDAQCLLKLICAACIRCIRKKPHCTAGKYTFLSCEAPRTYSWAFCGILP